MGQNVNRYAWIISLTLHKGASLFDPHASPVIKLGHACSVLAKMLVRVTPDEYDKWNAIQDTVITGLTHLVAKMTVKETVKWLRDAERDLNPELYERVFSHASNVSHEDEEINEELKKDRRVREQEPLSAEFIFDEDDDEDAALDNAEENLVNPESDERQNESHDPNDDNAPGQADGGSNEAPSDPHQEEAPHCAPTGEEQETDIDIDNDA